MDPVELRPEIVTTAPVHVGLDLLAEVGPRVRGSVGVGVLPSPYVDGIVATIGLLAPEFDDDQQQLVRDTLKSSLVVPVRAGWRPFTGLGATVEAGYTLVTLGGDATAAELLEGIAGVTLPADPLRRDESPTFTATSTLHLVGAEVGWDQRLWRSLHLRAGLGWSFTVAASTRIEPEFDPGLLAGAATDRLTEAGETYLDTTYRRYAHPPTLTLATGWGF